MFFLIDAQLPVAIARWLERGFPSVIEAVERGETLIELA